MIGTVDVVWDSPSSITAWLAEFSANWEGKRLMSTHVVKPGDTLAAIAKKYGLKSWQELYNHPTNAAFRAKRPNPNQISVGDQIVIPRPAGAAPASFQSPIQPVGGLQRNAAIIEAVDSDPSLRGAGIILIDAAGNSTEVRGGPRKTWVYISTVPLSASPPPERQIPSFWDRWGSSVLSCGSATATGVVIYLTGGTASLVVGAFAVNSAALCGMSLGKSFAYDAWQEFEENGGGAYKAWLTVETAMSLADLLNGAKGAVRFLDSWNKAGKLAKLEKAVRGKKMTRRQLLKAIREVDPNFQADLSAKGAGYYSKGKLVMGGQQVLAANHFKSLSNQQARVLIGAIGDALTIGGTGGTVTGVKKTYEVWVVQYRDQPEAN